MTNLGHIIFGTVLMLFWNAQAVPLTGVGDKFISAILGDVGAVEISTCHHPIFTLPDFADSAVTCASFDGSFSDFHHLWDAYS